MFNIKDFIDTLETRDYNPSDNNQPEQYNGKYVAWELSRINNPIIRSEYEKQYRYFVFDDLIQNNKNIRLLLNPTYKYYIIIFNDGIEKILSTEDITITSLIKYNSNKIIIKIEYVNDVWHKNNNVIDLYKQCETCFHYYEKEMLYPCDECNSITCEDCMSHYCDYMDSNESTWTEIIY